jgi:hypothetical protein
MAAAIAANCVPPFDAAGRFVLDGLSARLARLLAALERDLAHPLCGPFGTTGRWGPNGRGPEIDDLIRRSALARLPLADSEPRPPPASHAIRRSSPTKGSPWPGRPNSSEASFIPR